MRKSRSTKFYGGVLAALLCAGVAAAVPATASAARYRRSRSSCRPRSRQRASITVAADASYAPDEFIGSRRQDRDRDGRRPLEGARRRDGAEGEHRSTSASTTSSRAWPPAGISSVHRRSPTPRRARRPSTSSTTRASVSRSTPGPGRYSDQGHRQHLRADRGGREGHDRADRRHHAEQDLHQEGKQPVNVLSFPDQNGANLAVASGRAQLGFADTPRRRLPDQAERVASSSSSARRSRRRPTASPWRRAAV